MYKREQAKVVRIGSLQMGGTSHIIIQSMTTTATKNIDATVAQIHELEKLGCELIRVAVLDMEDAQAISKIVQQIHIPLVADIHFDYRLALAAIEAGAHKIRINPGNIGSEDKVEQVVQACKKHGVAIRIGVNGGSLEKELEATYGANHPMAMYLSAKRHIQLLEKFDFDQIVISLKSSDVIATISAFQLLAKEFNYPLHIGITEAGTLLTSSIRSSAGLGVLLYQGLGNTLRISITGLPHQEIVVAKELLSCLHLYQKPYPKIIACPTCGRSTIPVEAIANEIQIYLHQLNKPITVAIMGCVVNGLGEGKHADIGIAGANKEAVLFKKGQYIRKIPLESVLETLKNEIEKL